MKLLTRLMLVGCLATAAHAQEAYYSAMKSGRAEFAAKRYEQAEQAFIAALKAAQANRQKARAHYSLAVVAQRKGEMILARGRAMKAARLEPNDAEIKALLKELGGTEDGEPLPAPQEGQQAAPLRRPSQAASAASAHGAGELTDTPQFSIPMMGTYGPCRIAVPHAFLADAAVFRHPIHMSDVTSIEVFDKSCPKNGGLPRNAPASGAPESDRIRTDFLLTRSYTQRLDPKYASAKLTLIGSYNQGRYHGPVDIWVQIEEKPGSGHSMKTSDVDVRKMFVGPIKRTIGSDTKWQAYAIDGRMFVDRTRYQAALNDKSGGSELFDVKLAFQSKDKRDLETHQMTQLLRVAGTTASVLVGYSVKPRASAKQLIKAQAYKLTLAVEIEFELTNTVRGIGSNTSRRVLAKEIDVTISRESGYAKSGTIPLGEITSASSGNVLIFQVDTNITDARPLAYVSKVQPQ